MSAVLMVPELPDYGYQEGQKHFAAKRLPASRMVGDLSVDPNAFTAILARGTARIDGALLDQLPKLELIASVSAGLDGIDLLETARRRIRVTHTGAVLANDVADVALALTLSVLRRFVASDSYVRRGDWATKGAPALATSLAGKVAGIVGLGGIGSATATRLAACGMSVVYHSRRTRGDVPYTYIHDLAEMARMSDVLVLCLPGSAETRHLIDASILEALGPDGYLINVARGTVVHESALVRALVDGCIAGAGLDVFENEPRPPSELLALENVVLLPHVGSATRETRKAMVDSAITSIRSHFEGRGATG